MSNAMVYRDMSAKEIDAQYNMRAAVPEFQTYVDLWIAESRSAREAYAAALDVAYGDAVAERLDVFAPTGKCRGLPVLIFFHGGYWRAFSKTEFSFVAAQFVPAGMVVVVAGYALCPTVTMDTLVAQCRRAVQWTAEHIEGYGGDPGALILAGHSAGAHIVAMVDATDWPSFFERPAPRIRKICGISGLYELEPLRHSYLQPDLCLDEGQIRRNSPIRHIRSTNASLLLAVGERETAEFRRQTASYGTACHRAGRECTTIIVPDANHYSVLDALGKGGAVHRALCLDR